MSSVRVYGLHPSGGPHLGATDVSVFGTGFAIAENDAARCRFGADTVDALVTNESTIVCKSPADIFAADAAAVTVPLEVSLDNGTAFTSDHRPFTFLDMAHVFVSSVTPSGGPRTGGTRLHVAGAGFRDLGGLQCIIDSTLVPAALVGDNLVECVAPQDTGWPSALPPLPPGVPAPPRAPPPSPCSPSPPLPPPASPPPPPSPPPP